MPTIYLLGLGWANGWVLFESAHHVPAGYELGELFQNPQLTHNVPTGYIALRPQCLLLRMIHDGGVIWAFDISAIHGFLPQQPGFWLP